MASMRRISLVLMVMVMAALSFPIVQGKTHNAPASSPMVSPPTAPVSSSGGSPSASPVSSPTPGPASDGTSIDQGIAYVLMLVALVLTYLIHPLDASSSYRLI